MAKPDEAGTHPPKEKQEKRQEYTAYDRALVAAAQAETYVRFWQADGEITHGKIISVDRFNVEVELDAAPYQATRVWLSKVSIVRTMIGVK